MTPLYGPDELCRSFKGALDQSGPSAGRASRLRPRRALPRAGQPRDCAASRIQRARVAAAGASVPAHAGLVRFAPPPGRSIRAFHGPEPNRLGFGPKPPLLARDRHPHDPHASRPAGARRRAWRRRGGRRVTGPSCAARSAPARAGARRAPPPATLQPQPRVSWTRRPTAEQQGRRAEKRRWPPWAH